MGCGGRAVEAAREDAACSARVAANRGCAVTSLSEVRRSVQPALFVSVVFLMVLGFISRVAPSFDSRERLWTQWPTEDGYLMLTIARNVAAGHGMSTAAGTLPTNGTQPLFTWIEALCFVLASGDRWLGLHLVMVTQIALGLLSAALVYLIARRVFRGWPEEQGVATLAMGLWFAGPKIVPHTMSCLETGLYVALVLLTVYVWYGLENRSNAFSARDVALLGILLGICLWARIDAVFLVGTIGIVHASLGLFAKERRVHALYESMAIAVVAIAIVGPWLLHNKTVFGSFMPISGLSESTNAPLAHNFTAVYAPLLEYATSVLFVPRRLEESAIGQLAAGVAVFVYLGVVWRLMRLCRSAVLLFSTAMLLLAFLVGYYGMFFGARHFVDRYLMPVSPFFAIFTALLVARTVDATAMRWRVAPSWMNCAVLIPFVVLSVALHFRLHRSPWTIGSGSFRHFDKVMWIQAHVVDSEWVGAWQTGTIGFFHDRTVNLDGKVNPDALAARRTGTIGEYVVSQDFGDGGRIDYIVDWPVFVDLLRRQSGVRKHFDLVLREDLSNTDGIEVLRRWN